MLIFLGIIKLSKYKNGKTNWLAVFFGFLPFALFFGFLLAVYLQGMSNNNPYDDHPSITDEEWIKDNYGGTEDSP